MLPRPGTWAWLLLSLGALATALGCESDDENPLDGAFPEDDSPEASGGAGGAGEPGGDGGAGGHRDAVCDERRCLLEWPLDGEPAQAWIVANYVDRQPGAGLLDYHGGTRTYEGHGGVDVAIASFRRMDEGVVVRAVAPGLVTSVHDGEDDRNTVADPNACSLIANSVYVTHPDGSEGRYLHFRKGSLEVAVGQRVHVGQALGLVGSSGCSQSPHLHFELRASPGGALLDPFHDERWAAPPPYDVAPGVMDVVAVEGGFDSVAETFLAAPTPASLGAGTIGLSVITGGTLPDAELDVLVYEGTSLINTLLPFVYDGSEALYTNWWNPTLPAGTFRADVRLEGAVVRSFQLVVE